jgi:hypothetical protein
LSEGIVHALKRFSEFSYFKRGKRCFVEMELSGLQKIRNKYIPQLPPALQVKKKTTFS